MTEASPEDRGKSSSLHTQKEEKLRARKEEECQKKLEAATANSS
jgi:hypothetical protein